MSLQIGTLLKDENFSEIQFKVLTIDRSCIKFQRVNDAQEFLGIPIYGELIELSNMKVKLKTSKGVFRFIMNK